MVRRISSNIYECTGPIFAIFSPSMDDDDGDDAEIREAVDSVTDEEVAEITDSTIIITNGAATVQT